MKTKQHISGRVTVNEILVIAVIVIFIILFLLSVHGCRCVMVKTDSVFVGGCSLLSDTGIENAVIEPNRIQSGYYLGDTDRIKAIYPPGYVKTE